MNQRKSVVFKLALIICLSVFINSFVQANSKSLKIENLLNKYFEYKYFNGSVLVAEKGNIIFKKGFGFSNFEWNLPNTPDTKFRIGSITKTFTSMLIMQLMEEGRLNLNDKISDYLPDYREDIGLKVTIHHLLSHTSGIPNYTQFPDYFAKISKLKTTPEQFVKQYCSGDLEFTPGQKYSYSNTGYFLLGAIIEKIYKKPYSHVLKEKILDPLKMKNTGFYNDEDIVKKRASGYYLFYKGCINSSYVNMSVPYSAGGIYTTVEDLFIWDQAVHACRLLSGKYCDQLFKKQKKTPTGFPAYGWTKEDLKIENDGFHKAVILRPGGINGFWAQITRVVDDDHTIILLSNTGPAKTNEMTKNILKIIYNKDCEMPRKSIAIALYKKLTEESVPASIKLFTEIKKNRSSEYNISEDEFQLLGYNLIAVEHRIDDAIEMLKLYTIAFPNSDESYFYLGDAYLRKGDENNAEISLQKSLELNPDNKNASSLIKKLKINK